MTLIIGMNLGHYVFLGADTRACSYTNGEFEFEDDYRKIRRVGTGLMAGAGLMELVDSVTAQLANHLNMPDWCDGKRNVFDGSRGQPHRMFERVDEGVWCVLGGPPEVALMLNAIADSPPAGVHVDEALHLRFKDVTIGRHRGEEVLFLKVLGKRHGCSS
jgi:hypothetical protein